MPWGRTECTRPNPVMSLAGLVLCQPHPLLLFYPPTYTTVSRLRTWIGQHTSREVNFRETHTPYWPHLNNELCPPPPKSTSVPIPTSAASQLNSWVRSWKTIRRSLSDLGSAPPVHCWASRSHPRQNRHHVCLVLVRVLLYRVDTCGPGQDLLDGGQRRR